MRFDDCLQANVLPWRAVTLPMTQTYRMSLGDLLRPAGPLLPHRFIAQHFDKNSTHNRASLETGLFAIRGPVPVCQGNASGRFADPCVGVGNQSLKVSG